MAIQLSVYNVSTKQKDIRYVLPENDVHRIFGCQRRLENEVSCHAFDIVLTEQV